ncbi:MAG: NPCBM/NEW2 domain-containing protein [Oscillospiraceae bacterium]|nr:NPCBM/NEW2 domain-containing protein [Oscillospiraceae bacterium]
MFTRHSKQILSFALGAVFTLGIVFLSVPSLAASTTQMISVIFSDMKLIIDGKQYTPKDSSGGEIKPLVYNGTTYLPLKAVAEAFGRVAAWDSVTQSAIIERATPLNPLLKDLKPSNMSVHYNYNEPVFEFMRDSFGNAYRDCIGLITNYYQPNYIEYFLDKQYSTLELTIVPNEIFDTSIVDNVYIDGDGKTLWKSDPISYKTRPQTIIVDVSGQEYLRISTGGHEGKVTDSLIILGNATLS